MSLPICAIAWNSVGITCLRLPTKSAEAAERGLPRREPGAEPGPPTPAVTEAVTAVKRCFEGEATDFSGLKLDLGEEEALSERIYAAARQVVWGHTTTSGVLTKGLDAGPEAARDVGQAMARNPVPLITPCHRVLAAGGNIGGFSAPGGAATEIRMLELEGFTSGGRDRCGKPTTPRSSNGGLRRNRRKPGREGVQWRMP